MKKEKFKVIEVFYDEDDYDIAIERELRRRGCQHGQVSIICKPKPKKKKRKNNRRR